MRILPIAALITTLIASTCLFAADDQPFSPDREDVKAFIAEMVDKHQYDADSLKQSLAAVKLRQDILHAIKHPAEANPWYRYKRHFVDAQKRLD